MHFILISVPQSHFYMHRIILEVTLMALWQIWIRISKILFCPQVCSA